MLIKLVVFDDLSMNPQFIITEERFKYIISTIEDHGRSRMDKR